MERCSYVNLNKVLELALTGGRCLTDWKQMAPYYGDLRHYRTFQELEDVFLKYLEEYMDLMVKVCEDVEKAHMELLPTPFLSAVINGCIEKGMDVTAGGACYNFSGIQMIQVANLADSLAALKKLVYDERRITAAELLEAFIQILRDGKPCVPFYYIKRLNMEMMWSGWTGWELNG